MKIYRVEVGPDPEDSHSWLGVVIGLPEVHFSTSSVSGMRMAGFAEAIALATGDDPTKFEVKYPGEHETLDGWLSQILPDADPDCEVIIHPPGEPFDEIGFPWRDTIIDPDPTPVQQMSPVSVRVKKPRKGKKREVHEKGLTGSPDDESVFNK